MTTEKDSSKQKVKISSRGGARAGAGRPKGSSALITAATLIRAIEDRGARPFEELLAEGYIDSIEQNNRKLRIEYERLFLGKVLSDRVSVDVSESEDLLAAKKQAFAEALGKLTGITNTTK
jgi:hypothetical protein